MPVPPMLANHPPATSRPSGKSASALTSLELPKSPTPIAVHAPPFHRAILPAGTPPAAVNLPPTARSPLGRGSRQRTSSLSPPPSVLHVTPSHTAMFEHSVVR